MVRATSFIALLLVFVASRGVAQTQVENFARVLRDKQIITSSDYDRIVRASPGKDLALLTTILHDKYRSCQDPLTRRNTARDSRVVAE
jgi:hypothetical protein